MVLDRRTMLWRGLRRRCPVCGSGGLFSGPFKIRERCPRCHLRFERIEGHWIGSLGLNVIFSFTLIFFILVIAVAVTYPDVPAGPVTALGVAVAILLPLAFDRSAKTLWTAIDIAMRPLEMGEVAPGWELTGDDDEAEPSS